MVKFKTLKLKHYRKAQKINQRIESGEADELEIIEFAVSLVAKWDFVDAETGDQLGLRDLDELSADQVADLLDSFSRSFESSTTVPKENAEHLHSASMPLNRVESFEEKSQTGYTPLYSPENLG